MPAISKNVVHNSQFPGTCRAHLGTLFSLGGLQDNNQLGFHTCDCWARS
jgi:hypothetical protein